MGRGIIFLAALAVVFAVALPAAAEQPEGRGAMVVTSSSGGITTTEWFINDELRARREEFEAGGVLFQFTTRLFADGGLRSQETRTVSGSSEFILVQDFTRNGTLQREISQEREDGAVVSEATTIFDREGAARIRRTRDLMTLGDGSQVWKLTIERYSDGVLISTHEVQVPFRHGLFGHPLTNQPVAPPGLVAQEDAAGASLETRERGQSQIDDSNGGGPSPNGLAAPGRSRSQERRSDR